MNYLKAIQEILQWCINTHNNDFGEWEFWGENIFFIKQNRNQRNRNVPKIICVFKCSQQVWWDWFMCCSAVLYLKRDTRSETVCRDEIKHVISLLLFLLMRALWRPAQFVLLLIRTRLDFISFVCFWCLRNQHSLRKEVVIIQESNGLPLSEQQQIGFSVTQTSWEHEEKDKTKGYFWGSCLSTFSHRSVGVKSLTN